MLWDTLLEAHAGVLEVFYLWRRVVFQGRPGDGEGVFARVLDRAVQGEAECAGASAAFLSPPLPWRAGPFPNLSRVA